MPFGRRVCVLGADLYRKVGNVEALDLRADTPSERQIRIQRDPQHVKIFSGISRVLVQRSFLHFLRPEVIIS